MSGCLLLLPLLLIRFIGPLLLDRDLLRRAAHLPHPQQTGESILFLLYELASAGILLYPCWTAIHFSPTFLFYPALSLYGVGLLLLSLSMGAFSRPTSEGFCQTGIYRFSRNPIYLSYFFLFGGCVLMTQSLIFFGIFVLFVGTTHTVILAEERWCIEQFGESYRQYARRVGRYLTLCGGRL